MSRRVLVLTADYPPAVWSGIGVAVARQARGLAARGHAVTVLVPGEPPPAETGGPQVRSLAGPRLPVDPRRFDLVHLHSLALSELALELARRFRLPLVYTAHSLLHRELEPAGPATGFWCAVQRTILAQSDRVLFLSRDDRDEAVAHLGGLPGLAERARIVPNGVPAPPPGAGEAASGASPPGGTPAAAPVVYAGRFARRKGMDLLAAAAPRILARYPGPLALAGGHGDAPGRAALCRLRAACGDRCEVHGWLGRDELDALFARAALVLVPSEYEPFGLVALEAMRMGAPVLAAAAGGLPELVGAGSGGRLVASRDPAVWAAAALAILKDPGEQRRLRRQGPPWVASRFGLDRAAARLEQAYAA